MVLSVFHHYFINAALVALLTPLLSAYQIHILFRMAILSARFLKNFGGLNSRMLS